MYKKVKEKLISFENKMMDLFENGELPFMMHFCGGNEDQLIDFFKNIKKGDYVLSTHRSHYHYLLAGGSEEKLENEIRKGNSMFIFDRKLNFLTSSIVAGNVGIATGIALSLKLKKSTKKVWCFVGDGAEDEGHFYEAVRFVESMKLPCTFIIEDNDRSVAASKKQRGSNYIMNWPKCVIRYHYSSTFPHIGTGSRKWIKFKL